MRFRVDPWDPAYGSSVEDDGIPTQQVVDVGIEVAADRWAPRTPYAPPGPPEPVVFVDGVRRVEAVVWIDRDGTDGEVDPGWCASWAAGAVWCEPGRAEVVVAEVARGVVSPSPSLAPVRTVHATFEAVSAAAPTPEKLSLRVQNEMLGLEQRVATMACAGRDVLVAVDGPLRGREHLPAAAGVVKTHHVHYLPPELDRVVAALGAGQRTPVFLLESGGFTRYTWYLRLAAVPLGAGGPWSGVVRVEAASTMAPADASAFADRVSANLPRFASEAHKEPRAPQNMYPVAGLERELRRRLGDPQLLLRALRRASA